MELFSPQKVDGVDPSKDVYSVWDGRPLPWEPDHRLRRRSPGRGRSWQHTVYAGVFELTALRDTLLGVFGTDGPTEDFDGRLGGQSAVLCFSVNDQGLLLKDSVTISSCAWAVGRALRPGPADPAWLDGFEKDSELCVSTLLELGDGRLPVVEQRRGAGGAPSGPGSALGAIAGVAVDVVLGAAVGGIASTVGTVAGAALGSITQAVAETLTGSAANSLADRVSSRVSDHVTQRVEGALDGALHPAGGADSDALHSGDDADAAEEAQESDPTSDLPVPLGLKPLDVRDLAAVTRWVAEQLGIAEALRPDAVRVKSYTVRESQSAESDQSDFLNSFIAADLEQVTAALAEGRSGRALEEYLRPTATLDSGRRTDVRQQPQILLDGVRPTAAPLGRWPGRSDQPLVLSQQFAVNSALAELGGAGGSGLYAVNGPPGTGKTTMLRDLIAALVVQRAERLAALVSPADAFGKVHTWSSGQWNRRLHGLREELTGYEIVIASANNGAVENVTTEIPSASAVAEEWCEEADYLSAQGRLLLGGADAWGAVAAPLGNRANRSQFVSRFWWGREMQETADPRRPGQSRRQAVSTGRGLRDLLLRQKELNGDARPGPDRNPLGGSRVPGAPGASDAPDAPATAALGEPWPLAVRRFTQARQAVQELAATREAAAAARDSRELLARQLRGAEAAVAAARANKAPTERALADAHAAAQSATERLAATQQTEHQVSTTLAEAQATVELRRGVCQSRLDDLRSYDARQRPRRLRAWLSSDAEERWLRGREPLVSALAQAETAWEASETALGRLGELLAGARAAGKEAAAAEAAAQRSRASRLDGLRRAEQAVTAAEQAAATARTTADIAARKVSDATRRWRAHVPAEDWAALLGDPQADGRREMSAPWMDEEFSAARTRVFLAALDLHRAFLAAEAKRLLTSFQAVMEVVGGDAPKDLPPETVRAAWQLLFLVVPVVSTTFASLDRLFAGLGSEALGWLFIDEAGQATPQQAVGALWRARRAVVVGDPLQLEPVVTVPWTAQQRLRTHYGVAQEWAPGRTSVQRVADRLARCGTWLPAQLPDGETEVWVGSPLRVHRRCDNPMFEISNRIAYDGLMVFGTGERAPYPIADRSVWLDVVGGESDGKWVAQQGLVLGRVLDLLGERLRAQIEQEELESALREGRQPVDLSTTTAAEVRERLGKSVFVVSPFREVVAEARRMAGNRLPAKRVGTVHTTQGKEADVVILLLGTVASQNGARDWAAASPNLLNVAVSRARRRLLVIGDRGLWGRHRHFDVLADHRGLAQFDASGWLNG
ncbi:AAA domain-containing protein [Kitasatospora sp. NPDC127121]|uniref:AAA domain-containing protein n=1 Tax=Kitasatospora sp. NPDC127121 TaxID=3345371 RepID=UPI0036340079